MKRKYRKKGTILWFMVMALCVLLGLPVAAQRTVKADGNGDMEGEYRFNPWYSYYTYDGQFLRFNGNYTKPFIIQYGTKKMTLDPGTDSYNGYYPLEDNEWENGKTIKLLSVPAPEGYEPVWGDQQPVLQFGKGDYTVKGQKDIQCRIACKKIGEKADLSRTFVSVYLKGNTHIFTYTGKPIMPVEAVYLNGQIPLVKGRDYTVSYENNVNVHMYDPVTNTSPQAKVIITGIGNYKGKAETWFKIMPGNPVTPTPTPKPTPVPGKVTGLKVVSNSYNSMKLSWKPVAGAEGYKLYSRTSATGKWVLTATIKGKNTVSYIHKKLTSGKKYYYRMLACNKNGNGSYCAQVSGSPVPAAPAGLEAVRKNSREVRLTWKKSEGASGYMIYRKSPGGSYKRIKTLKKGANVCTYTDTAAKKGKTYFYTVKAFRNVGSKQVYSTYDKTGCKV